MSFDWKQHAECLGYTYHGDTDKGDCEADRAAMIQRGEILERGVASLVETLTTIEALECKSCEAKEIAGGALAYAPEHTEHGLMVRDLRAENERLREALRLFLNRSSQDVWPEKTWEEVIAFGRKVFEAKP